MLHALADPRPDGLVVVSYPYFSSAEPMVWDAPGTYVTTEAEFTGHRKQGELNVFTFTSRSVNQAGELVCEGTWTNIVR